MISRANAMDLLNVCQSQLGHPLLQLMVNLLFCYTAFFLFGFCLGGMQALGYSLNDSRTRMLGWGTFASAVLLLIGIWSMASGFGRLSFKTDGNPTLWKAINGFFWLASSGISVAAGYFRGKATYMPQDDDLSNEAQCQDFTNTTKLANDLMFWGLGIAVPAMLIVSVFISGISGLRENEQGILESLYGKLASLDKLVGTGAGADILSQAQASIRSQRLRDAETARTQYWQARQNMNMPQYYQAP